MKKYFVYEIKRNWLTTIVLTAIASAIYLVAAIIMDFSPNMYPIWGGFYYHSANPTSLIFIPATILIFLCIFVPIHTFAFKTSSRQVDLLYSMPIRREKLYLVKSLIGLLMVIIPYTIAFWLGFAATAASHQYFNLVGFVPAFFISIPLAIALFGFNAFVFTRANRLIDGIIFIAMYSIVVMVIMLFFNEAGYHRPTTFDTPALFFYYNPYFAFVYLFYNANTVIRNNVPNSFNWSLFSEINYGFMGYVYLSLIGAAAWLALIFVSPLEKAENAERISDSIWGYKVLLPIFISVGLGLTLSLLWVFIIVAAISGTVWYIVYKRTAKLKWVDLVSIAGSLLFGGLLSLFIAW